LALFSAELPAPVLPAGVGVNIHFITGHEKDLDLIKAAGFKFIRMDFSWSGTERNKGEYDWAGYTELLDNLDKRGMRAVFILDYSNALYEESIISKNPIDGELRRTVASPRKPESVAAFAAWAGAAAGNFKNRKVIWEIWNEPNIHFWSPEPNVTNYITLAKATCEAVRKADPGATVVGPATSGFPWEFLEQCFKGGLLECWDAVSVHPYRSYTHAPETAEAEYKRLRELIDRYTPAARKSTPPPILSGEWGYATHTKGISTEEQAAFIVRQQLANLFYGVPLSIWYDWKNDGPDAKEREHNFGTVLQDLDPKPAYIAVQVFTRQLDGYSIKQRLNLPPSDAWVLLLQNGQGDQKLAAWTAGKDQKVDVGLSGTQQKIFAAVDGLGKDLSLEATAAGLTLELKPAPIFVSVGPATIKTR
jgi:hypothetical protein